MLFVRGTIAHTPVRGELEVLKDRLLVVDDAGRILASEPGTAEAGCLAQHGGKPEDVLRLEVRPRAALVLHMLTWLTKGLHSSSH